MSVAFNPDGTRLAISAPEGVRVVDPISGEELLTIPTGTGLFVFNSDWTRLVTGSEGTEAKVRDAGTGQELLTLNGHTQRMADAAFSPDGEHLATVSFDQTACGHHPGKELATLPDQTGLSLQPGWNNYFGGTDGTACGVRPAVKADDLSGHNDGWGRLQSGWDGLGVRQRGCDGQGLGCRHWPAEAGSPGPRNCGA
jgi:hypothetical protein